MKSSALRRRSMSRRSLNHSILPTRSHLKFAVHAWSEDGKQHIDESLLATLYDLPVGSWIAWDDDNDQRHSGRDSSDYVHLYPRREGDYARQLALAIRQAAK